MENILLKQLFAQLEGIVSIPTINLLNENKIISFIDDDKKHSLHELANSFNANAGYLHVALHTLSSLGLLDKFIDDDNVEFKTTPYSKRYLEIFTSLSFYDKISPHLNAIINSDFTDLTISAYHHFLNDTIQKIVYIQKNLYSIDDDIAKRIAFHVEGILLSPLFIYNNYINGNEKIIETNFEIIKNILSLNPNYNDNYFQYFTNKSKSYGVTLSYQPIYSNLNKLIFSDKNLLYKRDKNNDEIHVNRRLNVWGSGGAHKTYFKKIDDIIIDIFNQPIESQPSGIADMGCGDGMFLTHLYKLIINKTLRGKRIKEYPLILIGADLNKKALESAKINLDLKNINCHFLISDISNPDQFQKDLQSKFNIDMTELLHVRSFLDHNRIYMDVRKYKKSQNLTSSCAYSHKGEHLNSSKITSNLIYHFDLWKPHIKKHGLILLELHGLSLALSQKNKMLTPTVAYESTHGYSDQYIVEYDIFLECAKIAGLDRIKKYTKVYPNDKLVTVSLNLFR